MKMKKGKQTFEVNGAIQLAAFKAAGWEEAKQPARGKKSEAAEPAEEQQAAEAAE